MPCLAHAEEIRIAHVHCARATFVRLNAEITERLSRRERERKMSNSSNDAYPIGSGPETQRRGEAAPTVRRRSSSISHEVCQSNTLAISYLRISCRMQFVRACHCPFPCRSFALHIDQAWISLPPSSTPLACPSPAHLPQGPDRRHLGGPHQPFRAEARGTVRPAA